MKIEIFKKPKKNFRKGGFHINPDISWEFVLYGAFAVIFTFFVFGFYLFGKVDQEVISTGSNANTQTNTINKERIDKVLQYFTDRENKSNNILNSPPQLVDPSL